MSDYLLHESNGYHETYADNNIDRGDMTRYVRAVPRKFSWGVLSLHVLTNMGVADDRWA